VDELAELWAAAARQSYDEAKRGYAAPGGPTNFAQAKSARTTGARLASNTCLQFPFVARAGLFTGLCPQSASTLLGTGFWNNARLTKHN
jgi:hypothetical protein